VADHVLSCVLRLLHPFMPHITEELWHRMGFGDSSIQFAPLKNLRVDQIRLNPDDIAFAQKVYEAATLTRNLRAEYRIPSNKRVRMILKPARSGDFSVFGRLVNGAPFEIDPEFVAKPGVPFGVTPLGQVFIPLEGIIDLSVEKERLTKEIAKLDAELEIVRKKLGSESFVARAPAAVVAEHRQREKDFLARLGQLQERVAGLGEPLTGQDSSQKAEKK
jgi:valyl-tRNA synthetase